MSRPRNEKPLVGGPIPPLEYNGDGSLYWTIACRRWIETNRKAGVSEARIAEALGVSRSTIRDAVCPREVMAKPVGAAREAMTRIRNEEIVWAAAKASEEGMDTAWDYLAEVLKVEIERRMEADGAKKPI